MGKHRVLRQSRFDNLEDYIRLQVTVVDSGCWEWNGCRDGFGYGVVNRNKTTVRVHKVSYEIFKGPVPKGLCVCHSCDNPPCCNPNHLWVGTYSDNMRDMADKRRHPKYKLFPGDVAIIKWRYEVGREEIKVISKDYHMTPQAIGRILGNRVWPNDGGVVQYTPEHKRRRKEFPQEALELLRLGTPKVEIVRMFGMSYRRLREELNSLRMR